MPEMNPPPSQPRAAKIMRALHRDIGFFIVGLTLIYAVSGIVLIFRGFDFANHQVQVEKTLPPNLSPDELGKTLHIRNFMVLKTEGQTVFFRNGTYNSGKGLAVYTVNEPYFPINRFIQFHKTSTDNVTFWFAVLYGTLLAFMAVSSFWMFNWRSKMFRRGALLSGLGCVFAIIILCL
jgi:hypothetical protein